MEDKEAIRELNLEDHLTNIGERILVSKEAITEIRERLKEKSVKLQLHEREITSK